MLKFREIREKKAMGEEMKTAKKSNKKIVLTAAVVIMLAIVAIVVALKQMKAQQLAEQLDLGVKYLSMMEYERAMDAYLDAIEIEPECVEAYFGLAAVYYETGEAEKAEAVLHQAEVDVSGIFSYGLAPSDDGKGQLEIQGLSEISLKVVVIPEKIDGYPVKKISFRDCENLTYVIIPDSVTEIGDMAFYDCDSLTSVTIPDSVTEIGDGAFYDCDSLISVTIPGSVMKIGESAFKGCESLTSVTISGGVTEIGGWAFRDCESLTNITIPDSVMKIGEGTFYDCDSLTSVTIPGSVTEIGDRVVMGVGVFEKCDSLTDVTILDGVTTIGWNTFSYCDSLTDIVIPGSVTTIYGLDRCRNLKTIHTPQGSEAERWAKAEGYEVVYTLP